MKQEEFLSRYKFNIRQDKIGGGSFGTVYKAYDHVLDRYVAIKVSEVKHVGDKEFSLQVEFDAISNLPPHANIAHYESVYTFESFQGLFDYAVMQYYREGNLSEFLKNHPDLPFAEREKIVLQFLEGIAHLHSHKVVHRDLKPGNILVVKRGNGEIVPKITDFGLSKQASEGEQASRFTNSFAGGTIQYSSPEQIRGEKLRLNTDLWSFGVIAYEIFINEKLFQTSGFSSASVEWQNQVTQQILKEDITAKLKSLPEHWQRVLESCLRRDFHERVQSTDEIKRLLNQSDRTEINEKTTVNAGSMPERTVLMDDDRSAMEETRIAEKSTGSSRQKQRGSSKSKVLVLVTLGVVIVGIAAFLYLNKDTDDKKASERVLATFEENGLYGYKLGDSIVIAPRYKEAASFAENKAKVSTQDSTFYIDMNGQWVASIIDTTAAKIAENKKSDNTKTDDNKADISKKDDAKKDNATTDKTKIDQTKKDESKPDIKEITERGLKLYYAGKYKEAYPLILQGAQANNSKAQHAVAYTLAKGYGGVKQNYDEAYNWYKKAADQGSVESMNNIGSLYQYGQGVTKSFTQAKYWYEKAAEKNYALSMTNLGDLYYYDKGVNRSYTQAKYWYEKAAGKGSELSMFNLGYMYNFGQGVTLSYTQAKYWYEKAAEKDYDLAMFNLGILYEKGQGVTQSYDQAKYWYEKAANKGYAGAMTNLGIFYYYGYSVTQDYTLAKYWYDKAADKGNANAMFNIGILYENGQGVAQSETQYKYWYKKACESGYQPACSLY